MNIIDQYIFIGEINIPNLDQPAVLENLNWFIDKYSRKLLMLVMGEDFAKEFISAIESLNPSQNWIDLNSLPELKEAIADYVYFFWMKNQATSTTGTGEVKTKNENSTIVPPTVKMVRAWNEMVGDNFHVVCYLNSNRAIFPTWNHFEPVIYGNFFYSVSRERSEVFKRKNSLGL